MTKYPECWCLNLELSHEVFLFAQAMAQRDGYFSARDYIKALINMAVLTALDDEDWPVKRNVSPAPDLDDGLPY